MRTTAGTADQAGLTGMPRRRRARVRSVIAGDDGVGLDLDHEVGMHERRDLHQGGRGTDVTEDLAMGLVASGTLVRVTRRTSRTEAGDRSPDRQACKTSTRQRVPGALASFLSAVTRGASSNSARAT